MSRCVAIIANPIAGGGRGARAAADLARELEARGIAADVTLTERAGDARERARAIDSSFWAVAAVGGDGTVNEILNGLPDPSTRFAVLPLGTANVLACELRLPKDPARCAEIIDRGHEVRAAVGLAGARRFLLFAGFGVDARMVARLEQVRRGTLGKHKWLAPVLHTVWHWPLVPMRIKTAEGEARDGLTQVLVTRVRAYGGVFRMPDGIDIEGDRLHVLCFRQTTRMQYLAAAWRAVRGTLRPGLDLEILETTGLRVEADEAVPCQIDGDLGESTPLDVRLAGSSARLLVPS